MRRKLVAALALVAGWIVGLALYRRTAARRRERVDLYFEDGSMLSLAEATPESYRLLPLAREALRAAQSP
jgi:hypothetical protein